jgi:hypothetical protein
VNFIAAIDWDWSITIPVGSCPHDDEVLRRLRRIEAGFNKKYVVTRYHKVPDTKRYMMAVAFEGQTKCGSRHTHVLVRIPSGQKKRVSRAMLVGMFPFEFRFLWHKFSPTPALWVEKRNRFRWEVEVEHESVIAIARANAARKIYTVKQIRESDVAWSRFEFVTPAKFGIFQNENLRAIKNRDRQKRLALGLG